MESSDNLVRGLDYYARVLIGMRVESVGIGREPESEGGEDYVVVTLRGDGHRSARLYADSPALYLTDPEATSPRATAPGHLRVGRET